MRAAILFIAIGCFGADHDAISWIAGQGGRIERDDRGRIVAIDLAATWIGDSDVDRLQGFRDLKKLTLAHTRVSDAAFDRIRALESLTELDVYYAEFFTDDGLAKLRTLTKLERLSLRGTKVTSKSFETLSRFRNLRDLDIAYTQIDDAGVELLAELPHLERLAMGGNRIGVASVSLLRTFPALRTLDLSGVQRVDSGEWGLPATPAMFQELGGLSRVTSLNLSGAVLTDRGADRPGQKESLRTKIGGLGGLCISNALTSLDLSRTPVDEEGLRQLKGCKALRELRLAMTPNLDDRSVSALASLPALQAVDLEGTAVTAAGIAELKRANPALRVYGR